MTEIVCIDGGDEVSYRAEYSYDVEGKKLSETVRYATGEKETIRYVYDQEGRLVAKDYPDQTGLGTITYQYDSYGNCIGIDTEEGTVRESTYDGLGRVSVVRDYDIAGSDAYMETAYSYDLQGRVISMITEDETGALLESFHYAYDKNDQILTIEHVNNLPEEESIDESRVYTYDDHGNLIESKKSDHVNEGSESTTTYVYDGVGNRICMQVDDAVTEYTYNGLDQMLSACSGNSRTEYTYDARGNQVLEETTVTEETEEEESKNVVVTTTEMEYAVTGEMLSLTEVENGETTLAQRNVYDPDGIRICRMENGNTRSYYYDGGNVAYTKDEETVSGVNLLTLSGTVVGTYRGEDYYTYLKDVQGSSTNLVKEDGTLVAAYDYTDFGETTELTGSGFDNQICYTGGIYDEASKLYYLNARYYDPETGRFLAQDSYRGEMDDPEQWHLYVYCANNPINYVDPSGHVAIAVPIAIGTVITVKAVIDGLLIIGMIIVSHKIYNEFKYKRGSGYKVKLEMDKPDRYNGYTGVASMKHRWKDMKGTKSDKIKKFAQRKNHRWRYHVHARILKNGKTVKRVLII